MHATLACDICMWLLPHFSTPLVKLASIMHCTFNPVIRSLLKTNELLTRCSHASKRTQSALSINSNKSSTNLYSEEIGSSGVNYRISNTEPYKVWYYLVRYGTDYLQLVISGLVDHMIRVSNSLSLFRTWKAIAVGTVLLHAWRRYSRIRAAQRYSQVLSRAIYL